jgi:ribosomal protein S18 acetylase RimI-like enzyme
MLFRPYTNADREACLATFDSNAQRFFSPGDRSVFATFLDTPPGFYGVLVADAGTVVGCGGSAITKASPEVAVLTWVMVHAARHAEGFGRKLCRACLSRLQDWPGVGTVVLHTSNETAGFFPKLGFRDVAMIPNGYRVGFDRYDMELIADDLQSALS